MLNSHDLADRRIIAAVREHRMLGKNRYKIVQLDEPFQRGWRRHHILSNQALHRQDRSTLEVILKVIGSVVLHHDRTFRRRRRRSKKLIEIEQPLRPIPIHEWQRKNYPDNWLRYFQYQLVLERNRHWQPYFVFIHPTFFELRIDRNWIHHIRQIDPEIERRIGELERWLELHQGWRRYGWLKGQRQGYRWHGGHKTKQRQLAKEHHREIDRAILTFPEVDPAASTKCIPTSLRPNMIHLHRRGPIGRGTASRTPQALVQIAA